MTGFLLVFLFWVAEVDAISPVYSPNYGIVPPEYCSEAVYEDSYVDNFTSYHGIKCPMFHDGLACWDARAGLRIFDLRNNSDFSDGESYETVQLFCPTVSQQLTTKVMRKYCGRNGEWIHPDGTNDRDFIDDAECYPEGIRPTAEERAKLNKLTTVLKIEHQGCLLASYRQGQRVDGQTYQMIKFRTLGRMTGVEGFTLRFDGIACYPIQSTDSTESWSSSLKVVRCPSNSEFFNQVQYSPSSNMTEEEEYGLGWIHCLRDEYKTLLTKFGLDKYFKQGCAAFENELVSLPQTNFATTAYSPCSRAQKYLTLVNGPHNSRSFRSLGYSSIRFDSSGKAIFFCNNMGTWEGSQDVFLENKGCFSAAFKRFLEDIRPEEKSLMCPAVSDDIFGQWPRTPRGENATISCINMLDFFGFPLDPVHLGFGNYGYSEISRRCNEHGAWEKTDWLQCIPKDARKAVAENLNEWSIRYKDK